MNDFIDRLAELAKTWRHTAEKCEFLSESMADPVLIEQFAAYATIYRECASELQLAIEDERARVSP